MECSISFFSFKMIVYKTIVLSKAIFCDKSGFISICNCPTSAVIKTFMLFVSYGCRVICVDCY